ncbi:F0F1 ATP synthase subunit B [Noviherbaspirillum pedocola]|uniref:ATP synthase subunit b n=1 Tax=Noviherbaspirillum pedocola TaxID=2801341 RepID=A0A934SWR3_9BURK|nr:F0F1 ATP synthase subunit B [Noviherbaspirillum pedocola]MBK4736775.1 F0F1 ATP synthase subunit B [Noviherbaspirillum pedocola]
MNVNAALFGECVVFLMFVAFVWRYLWPPVRNAIDERIKRIADGLAIAERSSTEGNAAQMRMRERLTALERDKERWMTEADARIARILEDGQRAAAEQTERILANARAEAGHEMARARDALRNELAAAAVRGAEEILKREMDAQTHAELVRRTGKD